MRNSRSPVLAALVLLLPVCTLTSLAYASPPDPSWIRGIYDGADYDDVVIQITSEAGTAPPLVLADLHPLALLVGPALQRADTRLPFLRFSTLPSRAPPAL
jgi:hypothetical protein